jgi:putative flippase GtrA
MLCATMTFVVIRSRLWDMLPSWLQSFLRFRLVKFFIAGLPITCLGLGLYAIEVSGFGADKLQMRPINWVVLTGIGYTLNRLVWGERNTPKCSSGIKFYAVALACSAFSFSLYSWLTLHYDTQYLIAQLLTAATIGGPHYAINNLFVFRRSKTITVRASGILPEAPPPIYL